MSRFSNARFATVLAIALTLLLSGVVAGAAGQALIIGSANDAGVTNTSLDTTSSGFAWQMYQHGTGVAVYAISDNGVALAALAHNGNQHGLSVTNDGAAGTGAAIIADGKNNTAADLRVNSNAIPPLKVNSTAKVTNLNADSLDGLDSTALQRRVTGTCAAGSMVTGVNADGSVTCETDDNTTYTGAHPIEVADDTISLSTNRCDRGHVYKLAGEAWACAPDEIDGGDAATLDGLDSSAFAASMPEPWRQIGAPGQPIFRECIVNPGPILVDSWNNYGEPHNSAAFYKDPGGVVHLKGMVRCAGGAEPEFRVFFVLPPGYRPAKQEVHATAAANAFARVDVEAGGNVTLVVPSGTFAGYVSLDGITFRAAP